VKRLLDHQDGAVCRACDALAEAAGTRMCRKADIHITAREILEDIGALDGLCAAARRAALRQLTITAAAIAAEMDAEDDDVPNNRQAEPDLLVAIDEASRRTGLSVDQLYRNKRLPFRVQAGPGTVRFSVNGIQRWIRAKTPRFAA
jgi:predicted DNA-binding transcriptional regulator AlpA